MKKLFSLILIIFCLSSFGQVVTTKIVKVANSTTVFNENLVKDIEILDYANKRIYLTLKAIPLSKSISTCVIDVDIKELQSNLIKAKNGLYIVSDMFRDTIKLGGTLTEPTTISQNGKTFKILDAGHGSVFSQSGIAYTKIDTVQFTDSTLIPKMYAREVCVPYRNAKYEVNLGAKNIKSSSQNLPLSVGVVTMPTITKNVDGTVTISTDGVITFNTETNGTGNDVRLFCTTGVTLIPTDNAISYVYANYNAGVPVYAITDSPSAFYSNTQYIPVIRVTRINSTILHFEEYGLYGTQLSNKILSKDISVNGMQRSSGLTLSTSPTRISSVSSGNVWFAVQSYNVTENTAGLLGTLYEYYLVAGVWNNSLVTSYDASYYSDGTNRLALNSNKWVSKYFFRDVGDDNEVYYIHGNEYVKELDAYNEQVPAVPTLISSHAIYVGKIVIQQAALNGTAYPRLWNEALTAAPTTRHYDLEAASLSWTSSGHTDGINSIAAFDGTGAATTIPMSTYEPAITPGTAQQYWRGDKTWQVDTLFTTIALSDETTDLAIGTAVRTIRMPIACTLVKVRINVNTVATGSTIIVDINKNGVTMLSTKASIDVSEFSSSTAAIQPVISTSTILNDDELKFDIDQVGSTITGKGLKAIIYYIKN